MLTVRRPAHGPHAFLQEFHALSPWTEGLGHARRTDSFLLDGLKPLLPSASSFFFSSSVAAKVIFYVLFCKANLFPICHNHCQASTTWSEGLLCASDDGTEWLRVSPSPT